MPPKPTNYAELLKVLEEHGVQYVLVGGLAALLQGAAITTLDMCIVHLRDPDNVARLMEALKSTGAHYREHINKRLEPEARTLLLPGHHLLQTDLGYIDVLGQIGSGRGCTEIAGETVTMEVGPGLHVPVLRLESVIETKREANRDKDRAVLPILIRTLEEKKRSDPAGERPEPRQPQP